MPVKAYTVGGITDAGIERRGRPLRVVLTVLSFRAATLPRSDAASLTHRTPVREPSPG